MKQRRQLKTNHIANTNEIGGVHLSHWEIPAYNKHVPMESTHLSHLFRELTIYSKLPDLINERATIMEFLIIGSGIVVPRSLIYIST